MKNVRVIYINPDVAEFDLEVSPHDLTDKEFAKYGETYDLPTFQEKFNFEEISDLGYIRFIEV